MVKYFIVLKDKNSTSWLSPWSKGLVANEVGFDDEEIATDALSDFLDDEDNKKLSGQWQVIERIVVENMAVVTVHHNGISYAHDLNRR